MMAPSRVEGIKNVDILRPGDILNELDGKPRVRKLSSSMDPCCEGLVLRCIVTYFDLGDCVAAE